MSDLRIVTVEEHMWTPRLRDRLSALPYELAGPLPPGPVADLLLETGEARLRDMDDMGVDMQVLSVTTPATQVLEPAEAVACAREANDVLGDVVAGNPDRFAAFATLPTPDPAAAADELERAVTELGLCGAMIHGRTGDRFLDHPDFVPLLERAATLNVPLHLHPQRPLMAVSDAYYSDGLEPWAAMALSAFGWGWHVETAVNALRMILSGTFNRIPGLQLILGHWGEMVPFFMDRLEHIFSMFSPETPIAKTLADHFYIAPSGIWSHRMLEHAIAAVGVDRIVYSVDYPFQTPRDGFVRQFLDDAPISAADKQMIGHANIERLLGLQLTAQPSAAT